MATKNATPKKPPVPQAFETVYTDGIPAVVHVKSGETLVSYTKPESSEIAEGTKDWANKMSKKGPYALAAELDKAEGKAKEALAKLIELTGKTVDPDAPRPNEYKPKPKSRDNSCTSGPRQAFRQAEAISDKERQILDAIELLKADEKPATSDAVAALIGFKVNQVSGSVSVLLAKGIVSTVRDKVGKDVKRVINIDYADWKSLPNSKDIKRAKKPATTPVFPSQD